MTTPTGWPRTGAVPPGAQTTGTTTPGLPRQRLVRTSLSSPPEERAAGSCSARADPDSGCSLHSVQLWQVSRCSDSDPLRHPP